MGKISVIIPVYNVENAVGACIESVLGQTYENFELLLINDGSLDRSGEICQEYAERDERVKVWHTQNRGPGAARNLGIEKATGEWICFVDSDDLIESCYLENFFSTEIPDKETLVFQGMSIIDWETGCEKLRIEYPDISFEIREYTEEISKYRLLHSGYPVLKLYNRAVIMEVGLRFSTEFSYHEDHVFFWEYLPHVHKVILSSYVGYKYLVRRGTLTSRRPHYQKMFKAYEALWKALEHLPKVEEHEYNESVSYFVFRVYVKSLIFAYRQCLDKTIPRSLLGNYYEEKDQLRRFKPGSLKELLILQILLRFPAYIQDKIFSLYTRLIKV